MSKKIRNDIGKLVGSKILKVIRKDWGLEIPIKYKNNNCSIGIMTEGSYSDWWEVDYYYKPNEIVNYINVSENEDNIIIRFYNSERKAILVIKGIFHNDSDWDYGCYLSLSCEDLKIHELYYI
jgi:regulation of enolase protein 1 (concanavalin A-like superfamily)